MSLGKFFKFVGLATLLSLVYIHMQMQIIDMAYKGRAKEHDIRKLIEENGNTTYTILSLKSANNLGIQILSEDSDMQFADPDDIVRLNAPDKIFGIDQLSKKSQPETKSNPLLSFLSFETLAEARDKE